jgi:pilus assembly protein Flp/PilA
MKDQERYQCPVNMPEFSHCRLASVINSTNKMTLADNVEAGQFFEVKYSMKKYLRLVRLPASRRRRAMLRLTHMALVDDRGGEVLEYAVVAGLIVTASVGLIGCVGTKIVAKWSSLNSSL